MKFKKLCSWVVALTLVIGMMPAMQLAGVNAATTTQYEAEDFYAEDEAKKIHTSTTNASGGKSVTMYPTEGDAQVTITVSVEAAGTYDVIMNMAANSNPSGSTVTEIPMEVTVNNGTAQILTITNNKNYNSFTQYTIALELAAGTNNIIVKNVCEDSTIFVNLDYISITEGEEESESESESESEPAVIPDAIGRHEAENAISFTQGSASNEYNVSSDGNFSNGAAVENMNTWLGNDRAYATSKVNVTEAGKYTLIIGYAGGEAGDDFSIDVRINNGNWTVTTVQPTSAWNVVSTFTLTVDLVEGVNTIDISGAVNTWASDMKWEWAMIDYFELAKASEEITTPEESESESESVVAPDAIGTHEAENATQVNFAKAPVIGDYYASCSGKGIVGVSGEWINNNKKYISYQVNATEAGKYELKLQYCSPTYAVEFMNQVNGGDWAYFDEVADVTGHVSPSTGAWNAVGTVTTVIELVEGTNTINITGPIVDNSSDEGNYHTVYGEAWPNEISANLDCIIISKYVEEETTTPEPVVTEYSVSVDGTVVATVEEGEKYTLPTDSAYGYVCGADAYKAGTTVTVASDMEFTSIGNVTVTAAEGAGIRYQGTAGIRFQATVNAPAVALNSAAVKTGTIITANDIYNAHGSVLNLDVIGDNYAALNIENSGWYNDKVGTYCGSIVDIAASNYIREFIAVAYATITYTDGTSTTVYSNMTGVRSIKGVAQAVINAGYVGIADQYRATIDTFAAAK